MLFAVSILSGLIGSDGFYSGGLLAEIILPYAGLYGGGLGVFMLSSVIFVTGMVLAFGTRVFSAAEWLGEVLVGLVPFQFALVLPGFVGRAVIPFLRRSNRQCLPLEPG